MTAAVSADAGVRLRDYIAARAEAEGGACDLTWGFFAAHLLAGTRSCFGVRVSERGELLVDAQEPRPGFLAEFLEARRS